MFDIFLHIAYISYINEGTLSQIEKKIEIIKQQLVNIQPMRPGSLMPPRLQTLR